MDMSHREAVTQLGVDTPFSREVDEPFQVNLRQICQTDDGFAIPADIALPPQEQALPDRFWATRLANNEIALDWTEQSSRTLILEFLLVRPHCDQFLTGTLANNELMPVRTIAGHQTYSALLTQSLEQ